MKLLVNLFIPAFVVYAQDPDHFANYRDTNGDLQTTTATDVVTNCDDALTVTVIVPFDKTATVVNAPCEGEWHQEQASDNTIYMRLNIDQSSDDYCELPDGKIHFEIGRTRVSTVPADPDFTILFSKMFVEVDCDPEREYQVKYTYGELESDDTNQTAVHGQVMFQMLAMDETFTSRVNASTAAGTMTHLALSVNENLNMTKYQFMPKQCVMQSADKTLQFSIFDTVNGVHENDIIDLEVEYDVASNQWRISHILFMLGARNKQDIFLFCNVIVCDITDTANECVSNPWSEDLNEEEEEEEEEDNRVGLRSDSDGPGTDTTVLVTEDDGTKVWTNDIFRIIKASNNVDGMIIDDGNCAGPRAGRVEMWFHRNGTEGWSSICDDYWNQRTADVFCQKIFGTDAVQTKDGSDCGYSAHYRNLHLISIGQTPTPLDHDDVCVDSEDFTHDGFCAFVAPNCSSNEDSGVVCQES